MKFSFGMAVLRSIKFYLFEIPSYTYSIDTFVNSDTTSKDATIHPGSKILPFSSFTNLKLLPTELAASGYVNSKLIHIEGFLEKK